MLTLFLPAIHEYDAKLLLAYWLARAPAVSEHTHVSSHFVYPTASVAQIKWDAATNTITPDTKLPPWVFTSKLVAKPDQLIKRRGKSGLLLLNKEWPEVREWIVARAGKPTKVCLSFPPTQNIVSLSCAHDHAHNAFSSPHRSSPAFSDRAIDC